MKDFLIEVLWFGCWVYKYKLYFDFMVDRRFLSFICCLLCVLISIKNLGVDVIDNLLWYGMCVIEEGEDGFCENGDENMYFESVDILDLKDIGVSL